MATGQATAVGGSGDEFPILCETCLGPNPYVRMTKHAWGSACKVCERPFTSFRWRPAGHGTRPKKTEICQVCARAKNVCQTCLLDLEYGLPVQVRDASIAPGDRQRTVVPQSDGTREYVAAQSERAIANGDIDAIYKAPKINNIAEKVKRTAPRYERNRARICSFFLKGACTRGLYCPYRHEKPENDDENGMAEQNIRDRYYGVNDPVARKIFAKVGLSSDGKNKLPRPNGKGGGSVPPPPEDTSICTLFIGGIKDGVDEAGLRSLFTGLTGLSRMSLLASKGIAFADFDTRQAAEAAMAVTHGPREINGTKVFVNWGRGGSKRPRQPNAGEQLVRTAYENAVGFMPAANQTVMRTQDSDVSNDFGPGSKRPRIAPKPQDKDSFTKSSGGAVQSHCPAPKKTALSEKSVPVFPTFEDPSVQNKAALPQALKYASQDPSQLGSLVLKKSTLRGADFE